jgi:predicted AAA+ superfamily ATPase
MSRDDRYTWLKNYAATYLQRDIRDMANFRDFEPFVKLQKYLALQTGGILNLTHAANQIGVDVKTVSRYLRYFELSYQALLLPAWARNGQKRLSKSPKFHYLDNGVLQAVLQKRGGTTGNEFESLVVAEIYKQCRTAGTAASFYHLHTHDGFEIDLLIELPDGYIAFEIKQSERITSSDARHLKNLAPLLDKPLLQGFLVSNDRQMKELAPGITAVNAAWFLSGD